MSTAHEHDPQPRAYTGLDVAFSVILLAALIAALVGTIHTDSTTADVLFYLAGAVAASTLGLLLGSTVVTRKARP